MTIDFNNIREISYVGIRRAAAFMGFGINCADNKEIIDFNLKKYSMYQLIPEVSGDESINEYKTEFKKWIIANSFRELSDSFETYLDQVFLSVNLVRRSKISNNIFTHYGTSGKLKILKEEYSILGTYEESFDTINKARNCLYHRRGFVSSIDVNDNNDKLSIRWLGIYLCICKEDGTEVKIEYPIIEPTVINEKETLNVIQRQKKKSFSIGDMIAFTVDELAEICYNFKIGTDNIYSSSLKYFKENGANIISTK